jgi:hypothetical protein
MQRIELRENSVTRKVWMMAIDTKTRQGGVSRKFSGGRMSVFVVLASLILAFAHASAQQATTTAPDPGDPRGRVLLQQMVTALGGNAWLDIKDSVTEGRTAAFYLGAPTEQIMPFVQLHRAPDEDRIELTKKRDVLEIFTPTEGVEITYKGRQYLAKEQVESMLRRRKHSVEAVARVWMKDPSATIFYMGTSIVGRRQADRVRIVNAQNDNVTLELDTETHLPLRRTFRWRNATYKDFDEDSEEYDAYQPVQGFQTAFNVTRYHNDDMVEQRYIVSVQYNVGLPDSLFEPAAVPIPKN